MNNDLLQVIYFACKMSDVMLSINVIEDISIREQDSNRVIYDITFKESFRRIYKSAVVTIYPKLLLEGNPCAEIKHVKAKSD